MRKMYVMVVALILLLGSSSTFALSGGGVYIPVPLPEPIVYNPGVLGSGSSVFFQVTYIVHTKRMIEIRPEDSTSKLFTPWGVDANQSNYSDSFATTSSTSYDGLGTSLDELLRIDGLTTTVSGSSGTPPVGADTTRVVRIPRE